MVAEEYEPMEFIGRGSYGQIRKARRKVDGRVVARKEIAYHRMKDKELQQLQAEFEILKKLKHPNIVEYIIHEHLEHERSIHVYMEYCGNGDLARTIATCKREKTNLRERWIWNVFTQLALALYRCHNGADLPPVGKPAPMRGACGGRILHRDLKPENVFLGEDNQVKLGDFGLSKALDAGNNFSNTYVGTPYYMAPEIINEQAHTHKCDIWSLGCIIYELCTLAPPFDAKSHIGLNEKIKAGRYAPIPSSYSSALRTAVDQCLRLEPTQRPDTADLLNMEAFRGPRVEVEAVLIRKEVDIRREKLRRDEEEARRLWEERNLRLRHEIDADLRNKWEAIATKEIQRRELEIQQRAELEIKRRVDMEIQTLQARLEREFTLRVESEVKAQVDSAVQRKIAELELVARSDTPPTDLGSSGSSGTSSNMSEPEQRFSSPQKFRHSFIPESPADITMGSPSAFWSPTVSTSISNEPPPRLPLQSMLPPSNNMMRPPLLHQNTAPVSVIDPVKASNMPETPSRTYIARAALKESFKQSNDSGVDVAEVKPLKRPGEFTGGSPTRPLTSRPRKGLARAGTTGMLFDANLPNGLAANGVDDISLARPAMPNQTRGRSIVEIARDRNQVKKELKGEVAFWNPEIEEEMPSPFKKGLHRRM